MTLPANLSQLQSALQRTQEFANQAASAGEMYIKMGKDGRWTMGTDELELEEDSEWAVNPMSFATGWSAFDDSGSRVGEQMAALDQPPIEAASLPQVAGKWAPQIGMSIKCISGEDTGTEGLQYQRSKGGIAAQSELLNQIMTRVEAGEEQCVPIVTMDVTSYKHSKYGKIYTPVFKIVRWTSMEGEGLEEQEPEPAKTLQTREAQADAKPEAEADAPVKRRRRKAS